MKLKLPRIGYVNVKKKNIKLSEKLDDLDKNKHRVTVRIYACM